MLDNEAVRQVVAQIDDNDRITEILLELVGALDVMMVDLCEEDGPLPLALIEFLGRYQAILEQGAGARLLGDSAGTFLSASRPRTH